MKNVPGVILIIAIAVSFLVGILAERYSKSNKLPTPRMECKSVEPNEPEYDTSKYIIVDPNGPEMEMADWSFACDPNSVVDYFGLYSNSVMFYLDNEEWATFKIRRDGVVGCNISQAEFLKGIPRCLYSCMGSLDPNETIVIEWSDPNEVKE